MGQVSSTASPGESVKDFTNLPKNSILSLWLSYNLLGEGWALSLDQFVSIFKEATVLQETYNFSDDQLCKLFYALDTDQNGLVDALEAIASIGIMSGMDAIDKVNFIFSAFDFEGKGSLSKDEINLLFRSVIKGLQKISPETSAYAEATTPDAAKFATLVFKSCDRELWYGRISIDEFQRYCVTNPVVNSWIKSAATVDNTSQQLDAGIKSPEARNEWIAALEEVFTVSARGKTAKQHFLSVEDIKFELEKASEEVVPLDITSAPWNAKVQLLKPEELPAPQRWDLPEDIIDSTWINGITTRRVLKLGKAGSLVEDFVHRSLRYKNTASDTLLFASGANIITMRKNEETSQWIQESKNAHDKAISAFDVNYEKDVMISAENDSEQQDNGTHLIVWKLSSLTVQKRIKCPYGVKFLDLSSNGSLAIVVYEDALSTLAIFNIESGQIIYSKQLLVNNSLGDRITDVKFFGTASMFAVSSTVLGIRFFVNEESSLMGKDGMKLYEERSALYGSVGKEVKGASVISLCRLDAVDEIVAGTETGSLVLWRGRTASQVATVHRGGVLSLDFDANSKTLASAGTDGNVYLFEIGDGVDQSASPVKKGPKHVASRALKQTASFDIFRHPLQSHSICAVSLANGANKTLVVTASNEILEVRSKLVIPTAAEAEEAAAEEGGEEGALANKGQLGDDLQGGSILSSHFLSDEAIKELSPAILSACKAPGGGFVTSGSDKTLRMWSLVGDGESSNAYKTTKVIALDCPANVVAVTGSTLFAALSRANSTRTGTIQMYSIAEGTLAGEISDIKTSFTLLQVSAEGNFVAGANVDGSVYFFSQVESVWTLKGSINLGSAPESMDLAADNQFIRCFVAHSQELLVYDIGANFGKEMFTSILELQTNIPKPVTVNEDGEEVEAEAPPNPAAPLIEALKSIAWASQTCPFNFDTAGVQPLYAVDPTFARLFDRSNNLLLDTTNRGAVGVNRVPSYALPARFVPRKIPAHVGALSHLTFIEEGGVKLVTIGAIDGALRIWKVNYDTDEPEPDLPDPVLEEGEAVPPAEEEEEGKVNLPPLYDSGEEDDLQDGQGLRKHLPLTLPEKKVLNEEEAALSSAHLPHVLQGFAKSLGFPNSIELEQACSRIFSAERCPVPNDEVQLQWLYGCSSRQTRNSVRYTAEGNIAYPAGTSSVIFDKVNVTQRHVLPHKDEISCLDVHHGRKIGVSAHKGAGNIIIHVWKSADGQIVQSIDCGAVGGVSAIKISPDGTIVVAACQDVDHTVKLFSVDDGALLASIIGGDKKVLCLAFSDVPVTPGPVWRILQGGVKHFRIISYNAATRAISYKTGGYGADVRKSHVICASSVPMPIGEDGTASGNEFLIGLSDGSLAFLSRGENKVGAFNPTMKGPVNALFVAKLKEATPEEPAVLKVVVAGTNGIIKVLDQELQPEREWNLYAKDYGLYSLGRVRGFKSVCCDKLNRKILYSTSAGEVGEIDFTTGDDVNAGPIVSGHFRDKLTAMVSHPLRQECITAGEDKTLRVWDLETHNVIALLELPGPAICVTVSPNGHLVLVGLDRRPDEDVQGRMAVVSYLQGKLRLVHVATEARDVIHSVAFSPDGTKAFAGSLDKVIYVYDALNNFVISTTLVGHTHGVRAMNVAANNRYMCSQSVQDDIMVWDLASSTAVNRARDRFEALADVEANWSTRQSLLGVNSLGIFPDNDSADYLLSIAQSKDTKLLAVGDQKGLLKIYSGPSVKCYAPYKNYSLHSAGGLSQTSFSVDDTFLLTSGMHDKVLAQWKIVKSGLPHDLPEPARQEGEAPVMEDVFENSFVVKGVDFRKDGETTATHSLVSQLTNIAGVGNVRHGSQPHAVFCGHGEILTVFGKTLTAIEEDGKKMRLWNYNAIQGVTSNDATRNPISCIEASLSGRYVLAGCDGPVDSPLYLFYAPTGQLCVELAPAIAGGAAAVSIAMNDLTAACIGKDAHSTLYVFKTFNGLWDDALMIYKGQTSDARLNLLSFSNLRTRGGSEGWDFVTAGKGRIRFWKVDNLNVVSTIGDYSSIEHADITALARGPVGSSTWTGDSLGRVLEWDAREPKEIMTLTAPITAMAAFGGVGGADKQGIAVASVDTLALISTSESSWETLWTVSIKEILESLDQGAYLHPPSPALITSITSDVGCKQLLLTISTGCLLSLSTDSLSVRRVLEGVSPSSSVRQLLEHPGKSDVWLTISDDRLVRFFDLSEVSVVSPLDITGKVTATASRPACSLAGIFALGHTPTAASFVTEKYLFVAISDADSGGKSASVLIFAVQHVANKFSLHPVGRLHNVGKGEITSISLSPKQGLLAFCSDDGCAYMYDIVTEGEGESVSGLGVLSYRGYLLAHPSGAPVSSLDFATSDEKYVRTFGRNDTKHNGKIEVNYFDLDLGEGVGKQAGSKVTDIGEIETLRSATWATVSSPAAPEVRGLAYPADTQAASSGPAAVSAVTVSGDGKYVGGGYDDGSIRVYRYPLYSKPAGSEGDGSTTLRFTTHSSGSPLVQFSRAGYRLVSVGGDGSIMAWTLVE